MHYTWQQILWNIWAGSMFVPRFFYFNRRGQFTCVEPHSRHIIIFNAKPEKSQLCVFFLLLMRGWSLLAPQINLLTVLYDTRWNVFIYTTPSEGLHSSQQHVLSSHIQNLKMFLKLLESLEEDIFVSATEPLRHPAVYTMCGDVRILNVMRKGRVIYVQGTWHRKMACGELSCERK